MMISNTGDNIYVLLEIPESTVCRRVQMPIYHAFVTNDLVICHTSEGRVHTSN